VQDVQLKDTCRRFAGMSLYCLTSKRYNENIREEWGGSLKKGGGGKLCLFVLKQKTAKKPQTLQDKLAWGIRIKSRPTLLHYGPDEL